MERVFKYEDVDKGGTFQTGEKVTLFRLHFCIHVGGLHKAFQTLFMESFAGHSTRKAREEKINMRNEDS